MSDDDPGLTYEMVEAKSREDLEELADIMGFDPDTPTPELVERIARRLKLKPRQHH